MQTPSELSEILMRQSAEFGKLSDDLSEILEVKAKAWMAIRANQKSDTSAEREWGASDLGIKEMKLKLSLKALEKKMSAIRAHIRVKESEARNLF